MSSHHNSTPAQLCKLLVAIAFAALAIVAHPVAVAAQEGLAAPQVQTAPQVPTAPQGQGEQTGLDAATLNSFTGVFVGVSSNKVNSGKAHGEVLSFEPDRTSSNPLYTSFSGGPYDGEEILDIKGGDFGFHLGFLRHLSPAGRIGLEVNAGNNGPRGTLTLSGRAANNVLQTLASVNLDVGSYVSARLRLGVVFRRYFLYAHRGPAFAELNSGVAYYDQTSGRLTSVSRNSFNDFGHVSGWGLEYRIGESGSVRAEMTQYDFGAASHRYGGVVRDSSGNVTGSALDAFERAGFNFETITVGYNHHFLPTGSRPPAPAGQVQQTDYDGFYFGTHFSLVESGRLRGDFDRFYNSSQPATSLPADIFTDTTLPNADALLEGNDFGVQVGFLTKVDEVARFGIEFHVALDGPTGRHMSSMEHPNELFAMNGLTIDRDTVIDMSELVSIRGRAGVTNDRWLYYAHAGPVFADVGVRTQFGASGGTEFRSNQIRDSFRGSVRGLGIEYRLSRNASIRAEATRYSFGTRTINIEGFPQFPGHRLERLKLNRLSFDTFSVGYLLHF